MLTDDVIDEELIRSGLARVDETGAFELKTTDPFRFADFDDPVRGLSARLAEKSERHGTFPRLLIETSRTKGKTRFF